MNQYKTITQTTEIYTNSFLDDSTILVQPNRFIITTNTNTTINCKTQSYTLTANIATSTVANTLQTQISSALKNQYTSGT